MSIRNSLLARSTFGIKVAAALLLVALADILFFGKEPGSTAGVFALAWAALLPMAASTVRRRKPALVALALAVATALVLADYPSLLAWTLFWMSLSSAALLAQHPSADGAQHVVRLAMHALQTIGAPVRDIKRVIGLPRPNLRNSLLSLAATLALPAIGGLVFIFLFAQANPLVARLLPDLYLVFPSDVNFARLLFWTLTFMVLWPGFRPRHSRVASRWAATDIPFVLPGATLTSITISLLLFNFLFGIENILDIVFLWSGAPLPAGVSLAEYAHRGAYPLIVTALLAGAFVLIMARPDTEIGRDRTVRRLVVIWIMQNLILVISSIVRTIDYIDAYMLTRLRLSALIWMGLVGAGLILICWRMVARHSLAWLANAVLASTFLVLFGVSIIDLGSVAAQWNVRHSREVGGVGEPLDLGYLRQLGPSSVVALATLEVQPLSPAFRERVSFIRRDIQGSMEQAQRTRFGWTSRTARRLNAARSILQGTSPVIIRKGTRTWDGSLILPPIRPGPPAFTIPFVTPKLPHGQRSGL